MPLSLSISEEQYVGTRRNLEEFLPSFYSAREKTNKKIGKDFEAFLILQSKSQKESTQKWITTVTSFAEQRNDRNKLLARFCTNQRKNNEKIVASIDLVTKDFNSFRQSLFADGENTTRFAGIPELNSFLQVVQAPIDEIMLARQMAYHDMIVASQIENQVSKTGSKEEMTKELNSWNTLFSTYKGT